MLLLLSLLILLLLFLWNRLFNKLGVAKPSVWHEMFVRYVTRIRPILLCSVLSMEFSEPKQGQKWYQRNWTIRARPLIITPEWILKKFLRGCKGQLLLLYARKKINFSWHWSNSKCSLFVSSTHKHACGENLCTYTFHVLLEMIGYQYS